MEIMGILNTAISMKASDVHITVGLPVMFRINGKLHKYNESRLTQADTEVILKQMLTERQYEKFQDLGEIDFSFSSPGVGRFRANGFTQRGSVALAIRIVSLNIPKMSELGLPEVLEGLVEKQRGLILVTGPTGSGKSTTLAAMIDRVNNLGSGHIITIEDPIEYLHKHGNCIVNQREIGHDSKSFANALRAALRQDPDTILVGEMRDLETIGTAITAAETGHLVMSTLHTIGAAKTIDRVIDVFPPHQQQQIRIQLASVLEAVISQQLMPRADGKGRCVALEILMVTPATRSLIREGKTHQIQNVIQTGAAVGMTSMDASLIKLVEQRKITADTARKYSVDLEYVTKQLSYMTQNKFY